MKNDLRGYLQRPNRYENIDGTGEMFMGMMMLAFGLAGCLEDTLPSTSPRWMHGIVIYAVLIPVLALGFWSRRVIKERYTWPRTGYAAFPRRGGKSWWIGIGLTVLISAVAAAGLACFAAFAGRHNAASVPQLAILAIYISVYAFWVFFMGKTDPWKWFLVAIMSLGLVAIAFAIPTDSIWPSRTAQLFVGLVWLGSGAATLCMYLRHTKVPAPEPE